MFHLRYGLFDYIYTVVAELKWAEPNEVKLSKI